MTNCQNCGEDGECNEPCRNCDTVVDPCGEPTCHTCISQFTVFDSNKTEDENEGDLECPLCEGPCQGTCELAIIEQEINENAQAEKGKGKL